MDSKVETVRVVKRSRVAGESQGVKRSRVAGESQGVKRKPPAAHSKMDYWFGRCYDCAVKPCKCRDIDDYEIKDSTEVSEDDAARIKDSTEVSEDDAARIKDSTEVSEDDAAQIKELTEVSEDDADAGRIKELTEVSEDDDDAARVSGVESCIDGDTSCPLWLQHPHDPFVCLTISTNLSNGDGDGDELRIWEFWMQEKLFKAMTNTSHDEPNIVFKGSETSLWPQLGNKKHRIGWKYIYQKMTSTRNSCWLMNNGIHGGWCTSFYGHKRPVHRVEGVSIYSAETGKRNRNSRKVNMCWLG
jgi:hypothetical protein